MIKLFLILSLVITFACREKVEQKDEFVGSPDTVLDLYYGMINEANALEDRETGWISDDCDAIIWQAVYAGSPLVNETIELAEENGRFYRTPRKNCWTKEQGDNGAKATTSRDGAIAGIFPFAWLTQDLQLLERHAKYGKANNWKMGEPLSDGRVIYTPQLIGLLYQMIYALGGENNPNRLWPSTYPKNLKDYEAHLQVKSIWLRGEIAKKNNSGDAIPKPQTSLTYGISQVMYDRLLEHAQREPQDPFYQYVLGLYSGDMQPAIDAIHAGTVGTYVRCNGEKGCFLAHRIFVAGLILKKFGKL